MWCIIDYFFSLSRKCLLQVQDCDSQDWQRCSSLRQVDNFLQNLDLMNKKVKAQAY